MSVPLLPADVREAEKVERLRLAIQDEITRERHHATIAISAGQRRVDLSGTLRRSFAPALARVGPVSDIFPFARDTLPPAPTWFGIKGVLAPHAEDWRVVLIEMLRDARARGPA